MLLAQDINGNRIQATPNAKAICPSCKEEVIPKCGDINVKHWSHKHDTDCDSWSEGETEWHYSWKSLFPIDCREVIRGAHRADVEYMGRVIEFQHSSISSDDIAERELHYVRMIWVLDGSCFAENLEFNKYNNFCRWKWLRKSWTFAQSPVYIDMTDFVLLITKWTEKGFYYKKITADDFDRLYLNLRTSRLQTKSETSKRRH